jgi:NAD(P)H-dependent FMN reductase
MTQILIFAGSARRDSLNKKLAKAAAAVARKLDAEVTLVDLADYPMPLYHGDLEADEGIPEHAAALRDLMAENDAWLIACPEYNGSITPLLKNTIDWTSRPDGEVKQLAAFTGKVVGLLSASPGKLGGLRGLVHVRAILSGIGVLVMPGQVSVSQAHQAFNEEGGLADEKLAGQLRGLVERVVHTASALA